MIDVVIAYCVNHEGKVLIAQRPKDPFKGLYECPGGKREEKESLLSALHRELFEELGSRVKKAQYIFYYDVSNGHGDFRMHWFKVTLNDSIQSNFYSTLKWVQPNQLLSFPWIPHNMPYMKAIQTATNQNAHDIHLSHQKDLDSLLRTAQLKEKIHLEFDGFEDYEDLLLRYDGIITKI